MHKGKSQAMQRGALRHVRKPLTADDLKAFKKTRISSEELEHFSFGAVTRDMLLEQLEPIIRVYAVAGFRSPKDVSRLLNKNGIRTACKQSWTPQLAWFLLNFLHERRKKRKLQRAIERQVKVISVAPVLAPTAPLTRDEMVRRLSALGRIKSQAE